MERIARLLDDALAAARGSAAAVSVGDRGREVFRHVAGHTQRLPVRGPTITDATPFDLASVTKPMATVSIAMALVEQRRLDLDAPVRHYLSDAQTLGTVRQLFGHSAGCAAHVEFFRRMRVEPLPNPRATLVERAQRERCEAPGVQAVYSDLGFIQLGAVLERAGDRPLEDLFRELVAEPLGLASARYGSTKPIAGAVATELDDRGLVCGLVHDENCAAGGGVAGHAGLFAPIVDVGVWCAAMVSVYGGAAVGRFVPESAARFVTDAPVAGAAWRLGWDTPSTTPGVSQAGDRWPRAGAVGHTGYTGTSVWLDIPHGRWVALLTNRVHPTRHGNSAESIKALRRAIGDAVVDALA